MGPAIGAKQMSRMHYLTGMDPEEIQDRLEKEEDKRKEDWRNRPRVETSWATVQDFSGKKGKQS